MRYRFVLLLALILTSAGCNMLFGPDKTGEFRLSSEKSLADSYYLFGYSYEDSEFYRYPFEKDPSPDIINEGTVNGLVNTITGGRTQLQDGFQPIYHSPLLKPGIPSP